jgi:hypothetical protein
MVEQRGGKYGIELEKYSRAKPTEKFEESPDTPPGEDG